MGTRGSLIPSTPPMGSQPQGRAGKPRSDFRPSCSRLLAFAPSSLCQRTLPTPSLFLKAQPRAAPLTSPGSVFSPGNRGSATFLLGREVTGAAPWAFWGPRGDRLSFALGTNEGRRGMQS